MTREDTVGIIGAYGMTGKVVARELMKTTDLNLVLGGRDEARALSLATELGVRATARHVDIYDDKALLDFCEPCSVIVNCAAPSSRVLDTVAKGALKTGSHYVDPAAGHDTLMPHASEFDRANLTGLIFTGWVPGITGLALHHVHSLARESFDTIESANVYSEDRSAWSEEAFVDIVEEMLQDVPSGAFRNGVWKDQNMIRAIRTYDFPVPIGKRIVYPLYAYELEALAKEAGIPEMGMYVGVLGLRVMLHALLIKIVGRDPKKAARRLRRVWVKAGESLGEDGIVVAEAVGKKQGREAKVRISFYTKESYFSTGVPAALSVRAILENWVLKSGLNVLCDAVDPAHFLGELAKAGITYEVVES